MIKYNPGDIVHIEIASHAVATVVQARNDRIDPKCPYYWVAGINNPIPFTRILENDQS